MTLLEKEDKDKAYAASTTEERCWPNVPANKVKLKAVKCKTFPSSKHQSVILLLTFRGRALTQRGGRQGNCGQDVRMETQLAHECVGTCACCVRAYLCFVDLESFGMFEQWRHLVCSQFPWAPVFKRLRGFGGIKWDEWPHQSESTHMHVWAAYLAEIHLTALISPRKYLEQYLMILWVWRFSLRKIAVSF